MGLYRESAQEKIDKRNAPSANEVCDALRGIALSIERGYHKVASFEFVLCDHSKESLITLELLEVKSEHS